MDNLMHIEDENDSIDKIVNYYNRHLSKLTMLLGVRDLCKSRNCKNLSELVNRHKIKVDKFQKIIIELSSDSSFDQLITGDLYEILIDIQMLFNDLKDGPQEGSVSWWLSRK